MGDFRFALVSNVSVMTEKVLQAGKDNKKLSDVDGYAPGMLSHEDDLDKNLKLKLLHLAAWTGDVLTIEYLKNIPVRTATTTGAFSPLHLAASRGHTQALKLLLEWPDVEIEACSLEGFTALHLAAYGGHYGCTEALLQRCPTSAHVNARDKVTGRTPLHWVVCHSSSLKVFDLLLQNDAVDVCIKDKAGFKPLHFASMNVEEIALEAEKKATLLKAIQNPKVLDETLEPWMQTIFQDETKKLVLEEIQNSEFADRTPQDLVHAILEEISEKMVKTLLKKFSDQVNDKVGNVEWFLSMAGVKEFDTRSWRGLSGIQTVHPKRHLESFMSGFTPLHFAASQDNAELVSHLLTFPQIKVNEPDMIYGMTPLHCTMRRGSTKAFARLISFKDVDVNAQLVQGGKGDSTDSSLAFLNEFQSLETPLHLAFRFCPPAALLQVISIFCSSPNLKLSICNDRGVFPLQLGWRRSVVTAPSSTSEIQKLFSIVAGWIVVSRSSSSALARGKNFTPEKKFMTLQDALDILEQHPENGFLMGKVSDQITASQAVTNALLVSATLLFGVTFQASIQQPAAAVGENGHENRTIGAEFLVGERLWFYSSNISFIYAVFTIFYCLKKYFTLFSVKFHRVFPSTATYFAVEHKRGLFLLSVCMSFGLAAYLASDTRNKALISIKLGDSFYNSMLIATMVIYTSWFAMASLSKKYILYKHRPASSIDNL